MLVLEVASRPRRRSALDWIRTHESLIANVIQWAIAVSTLYCNDVWFAVIMQQRNEQQMQQSVPNPPPQQVVEQKPNVVQTNGNL